MTTTKQNLPLSRRAILHQGTLLLGSTFAARAVMADDAKPILSAAVFTDMHHADKPAAGTRHYRQSIAKLRAAAEELKDEKVDFAIELGDLIDAADDVEIEIKYLQTIEKQYAAISKERHYVLGNHCVHTLTKQEFLDNCGAKGRRSYYSFDHGDQHFVVLDACFTQKGESYGRQNFTWTDTFIPAEQLDWLASDLKLAQRPTIVFVHQRIDLPPENAHAVKNAPAVRKILEESGQVKLVLQGHSHSNDYKEIQGIGYVVVRATIEGEAIDSRGHGLLQLYDNGAIALQGFADQKSYEW